jgi:hypothetical protein
MVELGLVDYFVMGEAVGIVATFVAVLWIIIILKFYVLLRG